MLVSNYLDSELFDLYQCIKPGIMKLIRVDALSLLKLEENLKLNSDVDFTLSYANVESLTTLHKITNDLSEFKSVVERGPFDINIKKLYLQKVKERLSELNVALSLHRLIKTPSIESAQQLQLNINSAFGLPEKKIFELTISELVSRAEERDTPSLIDDIGLRGYVKSLDSYKYISSQYSRSVFSNTHSPSSDRYGNAESVAVALREALSNFDGADDWRVRVDTRARFNHVTVFGAKKIIFVPGDIIFDNNGMNNAMSHRKICKLVAHEIHTHVQRAVAGFNSPLKLLSVGLSGYKVFEEGLATYREQEVVGDNRYFAGFQSYLAIGLALGLDRGGKYRLFTDVYKILTKINESLYFNNNISAAKHIAFKRTSRTFISQSNTFQCINTRDLIYRQGNIRAHDFFVNRQNRRDITDIGKFDPINHEQVVCLQRLGIIPQDYGA